MEFETTTADNPAKLRDGVTRTWVLPRWLKIAATVAVLGLLLSQVRWSDIIAVLNGADAWGILLVIALWFPNQWLQYERWKLIARRASIRPELADIRESYWLGHTLGFVTPGRIGAYGRGLFLKNVPIVESATLTVLERSYSAITVNGFGLIALAILPGMGWHADWANFGLTTSILLGIAGSALLIVGVIPGQIARLVGRVAIHRAWGRRVRKSISAIAEIPSPASVLYLVLAMASLAVSLVQFLLILKATGAEIPVLAGMLAIHLNFFLKGNIPLTLGNLGVGEWTALLCLRGLGVPDAQAVAASLILFSLNVAIPAMIGVRYFRRIFTIHHDWKQRLD